MTVAAEWAATVIFVRDHPHGVQAYLQRRAAHLRFAPGAWVFPGGKLDPADETVARDRDENAACEPALKQPCESASMQHWAVSGDYGSAATSGPHALGFGRLKALAQAAIRETFEECGVLLATSRRHAVDPELVSTLWHQHVREDTTFATLRQTHQLDLSFDLLTPIARWVTPAQSPRRFDTMFFLAQQPAGQSPQLPEGCREADNGRWVTPRLLAAPEDLQCLPPTWATLEWISRAKNVSELIATARKMAPATVLYPIQPVKSKLFGTLEEHQSWNYNAPSVE